VLERLKAGDKPAVEAWDREQKNLLTRGTLVTTDNQIDITTGTVKLKAQFPNGEGKLFPNQFVNVRMTVDVRKDAVVVPSAAIQRGAQGTIVYLVREDSTVALRPVTTGATEGLLTAIESGLQAGERVVVDGVDRIREGAKVEVTEPGAGLRAPGAGGGGGKGMDPAKREEMRKKMEGMTPEQRQEFMRKTREERAKAEGQKADAPAKAPDAPAKATEAPKAQTKAAEPAKVEPARRADPPKAGGGERNAPSDADREAFRKSLEGMTPDERKEAIRKRMESMTPEEPEAFKKRRAERQGGGTQ